MAEGAAHQGKCRMLHGENAVYFSRRAEEEDEAAQNADDTRSAKIHLELALRYRIKAWEADGG